MLCEYFIVVAMCEWLYFNSFSMLHWSSWFLGSSEASKSAARRECFETQRLYALFYLFFIVLFKNVAVPIISTNTLLKLILRNSVFGRWGLHCFGFFIHCWLVFDYGRFSFGLHWHLKVILIVCHERSVSNYQPTLDKNREEWRPWCVLKLSQSKH
jgi:hypothetical protein